MGIGKQAPFTLEPSIRDAEFDEHVGRLAGAQNLEYAVLLGHVLIQEDLIDLLALRLGTDSLPERTPGFEQLARLALAGSRFQNDRESLDLLNRARNTIAHRMGRRELETNLREYCRREWEVAIQWGHGEFKWPSTETEQLSVFQWAHQNFWLKMITYKSEYEGRSKPAHT